MHAGMGMMYAAGGEARARLEVTHVARVAAHGETAVSHLPAGAADVPGAVLHTARRTVHGPAAVDHGLGRMGRADLFALYEKAEGRDA
jgi:hypothetical protein